MTSDARPPTQAGDQYILGVNAAELERLGLQHSLWSDAAHALWRRAGFQPGWRVLDVGCGPGFCTLDLARLVGTRSAGGGLAPGEVVGVDESQAYLDYLAAQAAARGVANVRCIRANAVDLSSVRELGPEPFDAAYARWLMCFVNDPAGVIRGVHRTLKAGGKFVIQDYFNYEAMCTAPRSPAFAKAVRATGQSWRSRGGDPDVMGRVPGMLQAMGFDVEHIGVIQRLARPGEPMWHWPQSFWHNFLPVLVELGLLTEADRAAWVREWEQLGRTPGAFVLLPPVFEVIAVKRG
jgi:ubiquinone/menaquinone biosynthesis C-methylase UbiE